MNIYALNTDRNRQRPEIMSPPMSSLPKFGIIVSPDSVRFSHAAIRVDIAYQKRPFRPYAFCFQVSVFLWVGRQFGAGIQQVYPSDTPYIPSCTCFHFSPSRSQHSTHIKKQITSKSRPSRSCGASSSLSRVLPRITSNMKLIIVYIISE